ncbi:MAG TPA: MotA/TolQ/ExbB proton channel family protein [Planctomycetota bacterium]|nr:MotA/TolQ/ExbB proton channel family protein [Planctomycetota bacterium]
MLKFLIDAGILIIPIILGAVFLLAVLIDRIRTFRAAAAIDNEALKREVAEAVVASDYDAAFDACRRHGGPVGALLMVGVDKLRRLEALGRPIAEIEHLVSKTLDEYGTHALEPLERRMFVFPLLASIGPLLGMLGTVVGMIESFGALSSAGADSAGVAAGISVAFINTAGGLLLAVPAMVVYNLLFKKVEHYIRELQSAANALVDSITLRASSGPGAASAAVA